MGTEKFDERRRVVVEDDFGKVFFVRVVDEFRRPVTGGFTATIELPRAVKATIELHRDVASKEKISAPWL